MNELGKLLTNDTALTVYTCVCIVIIFVCLITAVIGTSKIVKDLTTAGKMIQALRNPTTKPNPSRDN